MADTTLTAPVSKPPIRYPSTVILLIALAAFVALVTGLAAADMIWTSFVKLLGKTLCLALAAVAMDLV